MLFRLLSILTAVLLFNTLPLHAQDLKQLRERVSALWMLRSQDPPDKLGALRYVEPQSQRNFLQWNEPAILKFQIKGVEFTDDPGVFDVVIEKRFNLIGHGELDQIIREPWVWRDGEWYMRAE